MMTNISSKPDHETLRLVMPGDIVEEIASGEDKVILGPGLNSEGGCVRSSKCGILRRKCFTKNGTFVYWVDCHSKRYVASKGENVIGVVAVKSGDIFKVDIGTSEQASLSYLAFEGATKKNRPNVVVGDVVYAKIVAASKDMEPELVCVDAYGKKAGLGVLSGGGFVFPVPIHLVRKLLSTTCPLLKRLGESIPFEIAVGMNGRVWVRAKSARETIGVVNAILAAEYMTDAEIVSMVAKLADGLAGF